MRVLFLAENFETLLCHDTCAEQLLVVFQLDLVSLFEGGRNIMPCRITMFTLFTFIYIDYNQKMPPQTILKRQSKYHSNHCEAPNDSPHGIDQFLRSEDDSILEGIYLPAEKY